MPTIQFLIPLFLNSGTKIDNWIYTKLEMKLLSAFGGYTKLPGVHVGAWQSETGQVYHDDTVAYCVVMENKAVIEKLHSILTELNTWFQQESFFIQYVGQSEIFSPKREG